MVNEDVFKFASAYMQTWLDAMENDGMQMPSKWHNAHEWTVAHMANVLYPLTAKLDYENKYGTTVQKEYYRVDFSMYTYFEQSTWKLDYAIEHENAEFALYSGDGSVRKKGWFDEFAKLLPLKCAKSRVIIGYDTFGSQFSAKLDKCLGLLNDKRIQASVTDSPILLIIFPYTDYVKSNDHKNGMLHIVGFENTNGTWRMNELTDSVCDEQAIERLKAAYAKIAAV